ncbi:MAG: bifunctional hydroxymethylpyrimidine kinase/phosphomethylpyrimidine kinase [Gemmatimonadaceae bacterium]|nr:bifunctional hydroxymethylpyrimidine kinase/phosphomethylpyrimidine kinase [Gemmatimonadaceae bacterium]
MRVALTIAGSDSGGGAGIQADLKTFHRFGVFGTSAITAVTAQNTLGVRAWEAVSPALVREQIKAVAEDLAPSAFKTGMLGSAAVARSVAAAIREHHLVNYVLDPVMIATSGDSLLDEDALEVLRRDLIPLALVITPNSHEASALTGQPVASAHDAVRAAELLVKEHGAAAALVKGAHLDDAAEIVDVLFVDKPIVFRGARLQSRNTHGTGCTLSAAITAGLALGHPLEETVGAAISYVRNAIAAAPSLGRGSGPLGHHADVPPGFLDKRNSVTSD